MAARLHNLKAPTVKNASFRIHLEDANQSDMLIDFGVITGPGVSTGKIPTIIIGTVWSLRFSMHGNGTNIRGAEAFGWGWGAWRFDSMASSVILDIESGSCQSSTSRTDVFELQGTGGSVRPLNSGSARYLIALPAKDALLAPISWDALDPLGDPDVQLFEIEKGRGQTVP